MNLKSKIKNFIYKIKYGKRFNVKSVDLEKNSGFKIVGDAGKISVGEGLRLRSNTYVISAGGDIKIGKYCFFNRNCNLVSRKSVTIGDNVSFGPNVAVFDHDHRFDEEKVYNTEYKTGDIVIENGCWIGAGVIILRNTHIGRGSVIGAGTVVKGVIPPHSIVTNERTLKTAPIVKNHKEEV